MKDRIAVLLQHGKRSVTLIANELEVKENVVSANLSRYSGTFVKVGDDWGVLGGEVPSKSV